MVKIKVNIEDHFYYLSRLLLARILTIIKVSSQDAIHISLDLKKRLVNMKREEVTQDELLNEIFLLMQEKGYGD